MSKQTNKVAIVTGASRGIGAAVAERLARDGFTVVVNYAGDAAPAEALVRRIEEAGGHALAAQADVSDPAAVRRLFDSAETAFGGVDVLVNNAGIMTLATVADTGEAAFDRLIAVNLKGTFNTLREAAARLRAGGRIVNFSSSVVGLLQPTYAAYAATKAGGKPPEVVDRLARLAPLERLGQPEDIAAAVAFLAGPDAGWINGQVLRANGGII
jgi:3-oxoacyl-[acyl-carrier protein] reductase